MSKKLYVGNLPYRTTESDLRRLFKKYGPIRSLILISDKETELSRGYSFVELDEPNVYDALYELRDTEFNGRSLKISVATGSGAANRAAERKTSEKSAHKIIITEKRGESKPATTRTVAARRNCQKTTTEYMVANMNNYG